MTRVALQIFSIERLKSTCPHTMQKRKKNPKAEMEELIMAETKVIVIPDGKICDYIDGKFRNDTPEEYVRQTI